MLRHTRMHIMMWKCEANFILLCYKKLSEGHAAVYIIQKQVSMHRDPHLLSCSIVDWKSKEQKATPYAMLQICTEQNPPKSTRLALLIVLTKLLPQPSCLLLKRRLNCPSPDPSD